MPKLLTIAELQERIDLTSELKGIIQNTANISTKMEAFTLMGDHAAVAEAQLETWPERYAALAPDDIAGRKALNDMQGDLRLVLQDYNEMNGEAINDPKRGVISQDVRTQQFLNANDGKPLFLSGDPDISKEENARILEERYGKSNPELLKKIAEIQDRFDDLVAKDSERFNLAEARILVVNSPTDTFLLYREEALKSVVRGELPGLEEQKLEGQELLQQQESQPEKPLEKEPEQQEREKTREEERFDAIMQRHNDFLKYTPDGTDLTPSYKNVNESELNEFTGPTIITQTPNTGERSV